MSDGDDPADAASAATGEDPTDRDTPPTGDRLVVAQGTFDILHPGHRHYLDDAAAMGDYLVVIVARSANVTHKEPPVLPGPQRREMVASLAPVDEARLGHPEDIFVPIEKLDPDVIALGFDQHHDAAAIREALAERGLDCAVRRATAYEPDYEGAVLSTGAIVERVLDERG